MIVAKVLTQKITAKDSCLKEPKAKKTKLIRVNSTEPLEQAKKNKKDKKKRFQGQKRKYIKESKEQTLATGVNVPKTGLKKKYLHIQYYNGNKKGHYLKFYPEPPKNQCQFWQSLYW